VKYSRSVEDEDEDEAKGSEGEVDSAKMKVFGGSGGKAVGCELDASVASKAGGRHGTHIAAETRQPVQLDVPLCHHSPAVLRTFRFLSLPFRIPALNCRSHKDPDA
jgi:hypothetical protein